MCDKCHQMRISQIATPAVGITLHFNYSNKLRLSGLQLCWLRTSAWQRCVTRQWETNIHSDVVIWLEYCFRFTEVIVSLVVDFCYFTCIRLLRNNQMIFDRSSLESMFSDMGYVAQRHCWGYYSGHPTCSQAPVWLPDLQMSCSDFT